MAHCQHTVEKALKAVLAARDVIITDRHDVSEDLRQTYADWSLCGELADIAIAMESIGFRTEYPLYTHRPQLGGEDHTAQSTLPHHRADGGLCRDFVLSSMVSLSNHQSNDPRAGGLSAGGRGMVL